MKRAIADLTMNRQEHWNRVYQSKAPKEVSWFQIHPALSLKLIAATAIGKKDGIIDVGGGASVLVDCLLDEGFEKVAVLDISAAALGQARGRLGWRGNGVVWLEADVAEFHPPEKFAVWHDRAVFHFLTAAGDRQNYVEALKRALRPDGHVIIATFAVDGPTRCSGLEINRYDAPGIRAALGSEFRLIEQVNETHVTPWSTEQKFSYFRFTRI